MFFHCFISPSFVDPVMISPLMACQLIALDKRPSVRPIGIGETVRRIIANAVLCVIGEDVQFAAGSLQLCAGQPSGGEAAVHAMREAFNDDVTGGMLQIDATNAFNSLGFVQHPASLSIIFHHSNKYLPTPCLPLC